MVIFCGLFLLISLVLTRTLFRNRLLNPLLLFSSTYFLLVLCYELSIQRGLFFVELTGDAAWLLGASLASFFVGSLAVALLYSGRREPTVVRVVLAHTDLLYKGAKYSLFLFSAALFYKYFILLTGYGDLGANIRTIRADYLQGDLQYGLMNSLAFTSAYLAMINLGVLIPLRHHIGKKKLALLLSGNIVCIILNDMTIGGAYWTFLDITLLLITAAVSYELFLNKRLGWKQLLRILAALVFLFATINTLFQWRTEGQMLETYGLLDTILFYAGGGLSSLSYYVDYPIPAFPAGRHVFGGIYSLLNDFTSLFGVSFLPERYPIDYVAHLGPTNFNTPIYLSYYLADFGPIGGVILSFLLGAISTFYYFRALYRRRILDIQMSALLLYTVFISIRSVPSEGRAFWILLFLLFVQRWVARYPSPLTSRIKVELSRLTPWAPDTVQQFRGTAPSPPPGKAQSGSREMREHFQKGV